jgi:hypothetical protein
LSIPKEADFAGFSGVAGWRDKIRTESPPELMLHHLVERVEEAKKCRNSYEEFFNLGEKVFRPLHRRLPYGKEAA